MRIVAGKFRGRTLRSPTSHDIRPTTDRVRESLFSILQSNYSKYLDGSRILDLFAGTGALGLEAISRGAHHALFVDNSTEGQGLVRKNIKSLGLENQTKLMRVDATRLAPIGKIEPFDLVFVDPPYGKRLHESAITCLTNGGWLNNNALLIIEDNLASGPPQLERGKILDERKFGDTKIWFAVIEGTSN